MLTLLALSLLSSGPTLSSAEPVVSFGDVATPMSVRKVDPGFEAAIARVEGMVWNDQVTSLAARNGLDVVNVTWEDTGRSKGSALGPNISDMTIGVRDSRGALHPMPVLRFDNFTDKTADISPDRFYVRAGNARGSDLRPVTLTDVLRDTRRYLHDPGSWSGDGRSLLDRRDSHVLVSAQAAFLPVPKSKEATFTPVIYNYQSGPGNPAVATIVATREGTSIQLVENDSGYMSDVLYFNDDGQRAPFTATRLSDFKAQGGDRTTPGTAASEDAGLNVVLVIQVPLKHRAPRWDYGLELEDSAPAAPMAMERSMKSDVEVAVIGHGETEGPFEEFNGLQVERDPRFPVRVTVQFYKATSTGQVTGQDIADIRRQIDQVYADADYVGSLVTSGFTGRPTEWVAPTPTHDARWATPWYEWHKAR